MSTKFRSFITVIVAIFLFSGCSSTGKRLDSLETNMKKVVSVVMENRTNISKNSGRILHLERAAEKQYKTVKKLVADSRLANISAETIGLDYGPFISGSAKLTKEMERRLDVLVKNIQDNKYEVLAIYGFADPRGDAEKNKALSKKRAESISAYLKEKKVATDNIKVLGMGEYNYSLNDSDSRIVTVEVRLL